VKKLILFSVFTSLSLFIKAQNVYIPDVNFKNYLLSNIAINSNSDTAIQVSEANAFSGILDVNNKNISDLTGIEAFINITKLLCYNNNINSIDLSSIPNLTELNCSNNQLGSLNLNNNTKITTLHAQSNMINSINLTNDTALVSLYLQDNVLPSINLSNNPNLQLIRVSNNPILSLDISNSSNVQTLIAKNTSLPSIDLSNNPNLQIVWLDSNISISSLNLKNGNNTGIFSATFKNNPNLNCIQVDDSSYSYNNWPDKDSFAIYSNNCTTGISEVTNTRKVSIYPNPTRQLFNVEINTKEEIRGYELQIVSITGKIVKQEKLYHKLNIINISNLSKGYYLFVLKKPDKIMMTSKLIITQ